MKCIASTFALLAVLLGSAALADEPVTPIEALQRGTFVTIKGQVARITDEDEFRLEDATGSVRVYVGPTVVPARIGDQVKIVGLVDDDFGPLEIYARSLTHADGTVITFDHRYP